MVFYVVGVTARHLLTGVFTEGVARICRVRLLINGLRTALPLTARAADGCHAPKLLIISDVLHFAASPVYAGPDPFAMGT